MRLCSRPARSSDGHVFSACVWGRRRRRAHSYAGSGLLWKWTSSMRLPCLRLDGDEAELGGALFAVARRDGFAIAGQDSNGTVDPNLFVRELHGAKNQGMGLEVV